MKSRFAPILYSWGRGLSFKTDSFHAAVDNAAKHFDVDRKTVMRALEELVEYGWAEVSHKEPGKPVNYRFIDHEEWAREHPGKCTVKDTIPGSDEGDPLGCQLHSISGGLAEFYPNQMTGLRKSGLTDGQIATEFRVFLDRNPQTGRQWKGVYYRFRKHLLAVADDLRDAANAKNSSSRGSHRRDTYQSHRRDTLRPTEGTPTSPTEGTQVFEVSSEVVLDRRHDTGPASQGPLTSLPAHQELPERGTASPLHSPLAEKNEMRSNKKEKELSLAPVQTRRPEESLVELRAKLAEYEQLIASAKETGKELRSWVFDYKTELARKIAEYAKEVVTA